MWKADIAKIISVCKKKTVAVNNFCKILHRRVLNMPRFLIFNVPGFWICQGYTGFWYAWICLNNFWTCMNIFKCAWMCLNLPEWLLLYFPHCNPLPTWTHAVTYFNVYTLTRSYNQKDYEAVFLRQNLIFLY